MTQEKREISQMVIENVLAQGLSLNRLNYVLWLKENGKIHDNCPVPLERKQSTLDEPKISNGPVPQGIIELCMAVGLNLKFLNYTRWLREHGKISDYYEKQLSFL